MIVKCNNCGTKFRFNEALLKDNKPKKVKCSKCGNVFTVMLPQKVDEPKIEEEVFYLEKEKEEKASKTEIPKFEEKDDKDLEKELESIAQKYKEPLSGKKTQKTKKSRFAFIITMAMLIIAIFVGSVFVILKTKNRVPPFRFSNLKAQYYENSKYKKVLVVKGYIINNRNISYRKIKLRAIIYDVNGKMISQSDTFAGNTFSKEEILNLTPTYVKKLIFENTVLKPYGKLPFMIFLFNLPKTSYSYQVEVLSFEKVKK